MSVPICFWQHLENMQTDNLDFVMWNLGWLEHCVARMDSDLEAFSHNPTDDSIATLAAQLIAFTMYLNEGFLSQRLRLLLQR